jgi:hypothetical protein
MSFKFSKISDHSSTSDKFWWDFAASVELQRRQTLVSCVYLEGGSTFPWDGHDLFHQTTFSMSTIRFDALPEAGWRRGKHRQCRKPQDDSEKLALNIGLICWKELFEGRLNTVECLLKRSLNEGLRNI